MEECLICRVVIPFSSSEVDEGGGHDDDGSHSRLFDEVGSSSGLDLLEKETQAYYFLHKLMSLPPDTCARLLLPTTPGLDDDDSDGFFLSSLLHLCGDCRTQYLVEGRRIFDQIQRLRKQHQELKDMILNRMRIKSEVNGEGEEEMILPHEIHPEGLSIHVKERKRKMVDLRSYLLGLESDPFLNLVYSEDLLIDKEVPQLSSWEYHQESPTNTLDWDQDQEEEIIQSDTIITGVTPNMHHNKELRPRRRKAPASRTPRPTSNFITTRKIKRDRNRRATHSQMASTSRETTSKVGTMTKPPGIGKKTLLKIARIARLPNSKSWVEKKRNSKKFSLIQERFEQMQKSWQSKKKTLKTKTEADDDLLDMDHNYDVETEIGLGISENSSTAEPGTKSFNSNNSAYDTVAQAQTTSQRKCHVCGEFMETGEEMEDHVRIEHVNENSLACPGCNVIFAKIHNYRSHIHAALKKDPNSPCSSLALACPYIKCKKLSIVRNSDAAMEVHFKVIHPLSDVDVATTSHEFVDVITWPVRLESSASHEEEKDRNFACPVCHKVFKAKWMLKSHEYSHYAQPIKCHHPNCNSVLKGERQLKKHEKVVHNNKDEPKPLCSTCGKEFSCIAHLRRHEKLHLTETPYLCSHCGKGYKVLHQLKVHMWSHDEQLYKEKYGKYKENAKRRKEEAELNKKTDVDETEPIVEDNDTNTETIASTTDTVT